jgi:hypothetical protein
MVHRAAGSFSRARRLLGVALAFGSLAAAACDRAPFTAPSGSAITLVASTTALPLGGATDITAFVLEGAQGAGTPDEPGQVVAGSGTPVHDGTEVFFTTSIGRIEPAEARTSGGRATARLISDGRSGTAKVTAVSGPATASIEVDIGAAVATRIAVTASPQSLPPEGGSSTISARVEDQQGNGVAGILVSFSTTRGSLSVASATTDADGYAFTTLTTAVEATVTATSGGAATALSGTVVVRIN